MPIHTVSDDAELRAAILAANDGDTIQFDADITLLADLPVVQDDITIDGDDHALNGADQFRGLFVGAWQAGTATQIPVSVTIQNLAIEDAAAIGGNGGSRGGGGAGLGGAVFVANLATVTVSNVSLIDNAATGGNGTGNASFDGGGGGMGGDGNNGDDGGGGSGGLGIGANGGLGNGFAGGAGIATGAASGAAGVVGGAGGVNGGGGGGAGAINAAGGGGGVGGTGKAGGFGGGGGGAGTGGGGDGGFGGGGGGGFVDGGGGAGGFGGGGGSAGPGSGSGGFGGFGGGDGRRQWWWRRRRDGRGYLRPGRRDPDSGGAAFDQRQRGHGGSGAGGAGNGAALGSGLFLQGNGTITFNSGPGQTQTIDDGIADQTGSGGTGGDEGSYGLTKTGAGTLILNGANTYSGGTTLIGGVLNVGHTDALGTGTLTVLGATLEIQDEAPFNIHLSNSIDLRSDLTVNFVETVGGGSGGLTGTIDDTNGAFGITKTGNGILALTGNNSYAGATNIVGGAIRVMGGNAIGDLSAVNVGTGAFLELFGSGEAIGSLSGSGDVGNSSIFGVPLTFGHNNVDATFSGVFSFNLSLVKVGTGKQVLSGNSTSFGGFITVNGGTLQVDGALVNSIATVNAGGRLGGNGTTGEVNVAAGGKLAPGASAGILNTGSIALVAGAFFEAEIGGTTPGVGGYDQVKVTGTVSLGGATLDVSLLGGFVPSFGQSFTIIDNDGSDAVTGTFAGLAEGAVVDVGGYELLLTYTGGDGNDVALSTGVLITGTPGPDLVDAAHTVSGQPLPTAVGDEILGLAGKDSLSGLGGNDTIRGGNSADKLYGDAGNDTIQGQRGNDRLFGGDGDDWLAGGGQRDKLTGGEGDDTFVFTYLGRPNTITDFADGDVIALKKSGFPGIGPTGVLQAKYFHAGEAETAKQKVLYDAEGGWLLFAKHGSGTLIPRPIVKIGKNLDLDHTDILVI